MGRNGLAFLLPLSLLAGCGGCQETAQDPAPAPAATATPRRTARPAPPAAAVPTAPVAGTQDRRQPAARPEETPTPRAAPVSGGEPEWAPSPPDQTDEPAGERPPTAPEPGKEPRAEPSPENVGEGAGGEVEHDELPPGVAAVYDPAYREAVEPPDEELEPEPEDSDSQPPVVLSLSFDQLETRDGTTLRVIIETEDNLSGAASAAGLLWSPSRNSTLSFAAGPSPDQPGVLTGQVRVPERAEAGWWSVSSVRVMDAARNDVSLTASRDPVLADAGFTVISEESDTSPPEVLSVRVEPREVEEGQQFKVKVVGTDEGTGIRSMWGIIKSPGKQVRINFSPRLRADSGVYEATVSLPSHPEAGEWQVTQLTVHDKANVRTIIGPGNPVLEEARVLVYSSSEDTVPPTLSSIEFTPRDVRRGDEIQILVDAWDDRSGVSAVDGMLRNERRSANVPFSLYSTGSPNLYEGTLTLGENSPAGQWHVWRLRVADRAGNRHVYVWEQDPELDDATFDAY